MSTTILRVGMYTIVIIYQVILSTRLISVILFTTGTRVFDVSFLTTRNISAHLTRPDTSWDTCFHSEVANVNYLNISCDHLTRKFGVATREGISMELSEVELYGYGEIIWVYNCVLVI